MANLEIYKYRFKTRGKNPEFEDGLKTIPNKRKCAAFESCQKHNKSENPVTEFKVKTVHKWTSLLVPVMLDPETGEIFETLDYYLTNEMKQAAKRKKKAFEMFCDIYEPLYRQKKVTMFFFTFTRLNYANMAFKDMLDNIRYHFNKILKKVILGYFWTLEVPESLQAHYHLCLVTERWNIKKIPESIKFNKLWGQRTQVTIIKKSVKGYMSCYLGKTNYFLIKFRSYGISRIRNN